MNLIDVTFEVARSARWKELVLLYGQRVMEANPWSCPTGDRDIRELLAWSRRQTDAVPTCLRYYLDTLRRCCPVCHRPSTEETTIGYIAALVPDPHDHNPNRFLCEKGHQWGRVCPVAECEWRSKWAEPEASATEPPPPLAVFDETTEFTEDMWKSIRDGHPEPPPSVPSRPAPPEWPPPDPKDDW